MNDTMSLANSRFVQRYKRGLAFFDPTPTQNELKHLPFKIRRSLIQLIKTKELNRNLARKHYKDRFIMYVGLPRSGGTAGGTCVMVIQRNLGKYKDEIFRGSSYGDRAYAGYMARNHDNELRPDMFVEFPEGGVSKFHPSPTSSNLKVIEDCGFKYILHFRGPADQLVNFYTYGRLVNRNPVDLNYPLNGKTWIWNHVHPVRTAIFHDGHDLDEVVNYLITQGYLHHALFWMLNWTILRDVDKSIVVRWEEYKRNPRAVLEEIARFTCNAELDNASLDECLKILGPQHREKNVDENIYPRGYTGPIGSHRNYFSKANTIAYRDVVAKFLDTMPESDKLLAAVPEILLDD